MTKMFLPLVIILAVREINSFTLVDKSLAQYTQEYKLNVDSLDVVDYKNNSLVDGWNLTRYSVYDQNTLFIKAPELVEALHLNDPAWKNTRFLEPGYTMQSLQSGYISRRIPAPQNSSVKMEFSLLLEGYNSSHTENQFLRQNIDFKISVLNSTRSTVYSVGLDQINMKNRQWKTFELSFSKNSKSSDVWTVEAEMYRANEQLHIIISNLTLYWNPILGENVIREPLPETTTSSIIETTTKEESKPTTNLGINTPDSDSNATNPSTPGPNEPTTTSPVSGSSSSEPPPSPSTSTTSSTTTTTTSRISSTTVMNNGSNPEPIISTASSGSIGYTGEVVLICLLVLLGISLAVLVAKYYFLQKSIGEYRVNTTASQYSNPSFSTESYRDH